MCSVLRLGERNGRAPFSKRPAPCVLAAPIGTVSCVCPCSGPSSNALPCCNGVPGCSGAPSGGDSDQLCAACAEDNFEEYGDKWRAAAIAAGVRIICGGGGGRGAGSVHSSGPLDTGFAALSAGGFMPALPAELHPKSTQDEEELKAFARSGAVGDSKEFHVCKQRRLYLHRVIERMESQGGVRYCLCPPGVRLLCRVCLYPAHAQTCGEKLAQGTKPL